MQILGPYSSPLDQNLQQMGSKNLHFKQMIFRGKKKQNFILPDNFYTL
jgi:hypothetical protein